MPTYIAKHLHVSICNLPVKTEHTSKYYVLAIDRQVEKHVFFIGVLKGSIYC